ncbi:MAG: hypothetical protein ACW99A_07900 [Candidatus Kariarchaeaceae archaeon]
MDIKSEFVNQGTPDPCNDKIISIAYQPFFDNSGRPKEDLTVLKSWETSEKEILAQFIKFTGWNEEIPNPWQFVPSNFGLNNILTPIVQRSKELLDITLNCQFLMNLPKIDLKSIAIIKKRGNFKKTSLPNFSRKLRKAYTIGNLIQEQNWEELENYIVLEAEVFLKIYKKLVNKIGMVFP